MWKYLLLLVTISCTSTAQITWTSDHSVDLYLVELDKVVIVDTAEVVSRYYIGRLSGLSYIFKSEKNDGKLVLVGFKAVDSLGRKSEWTFTTWDKK